MKTDMIVGKGTLANRSLYTHNRITKIVPVTINFDHKKVVGYAEILDDKVTFTVNGKYLLDENAGLLALTQVGDFSLSYGYKRTVNSEL